MSGAGASHRESRRFGVRAKLMLAFAGMSGMTIAASVVGLTSFAAVRAPLQRIVESSLPQMELAKQLAGESGAIAAAAPTLDAVASLDARDRVYRAIVERGAQLTGLVDALQRRRPDDPAIGDVRDKAARLMATLQAETEAVGRRLGVRQQREAAAADLSKDYEAFIAVLRPLIDGASTRLLADGQALDAMAGKSVDALNGSVQTLVTLFAMRGDLDQVAAAMSGAGIAAAADDLAQDQDAYKAAAERLAGDIRQAGTAVGADLAGAVDDVVALGDGDKGIFELRRTMLDGAAGERANYKRQTLLADLQQRRDDCLTQIDALIEHSKGAIKTSNATFRDRIGAGVGGLVGGGLEQFRGYLEIAAFGNILVGALNEAVQAPDASRLDMLRARYRDAVAAVDEQMRIVGHDGEAAALAKSLASLARFGSGAASVFDLRRAELVTIAEGAGTLDQSRQIAAQFAAVADQQIATMKAEADRASATATAAMAGGRRMLILVAIASLVGAGALAWIVVGRMIVARIRQLADAMRAIAGGNLEAAIPTGGSDEIADMADALTVFRDTAHQAAEADARAEAERARAGQERRRALVETADSFEATVRSVLGRVSQAADDMQELARRMSASAGTTTAEAATAATASQLAAGSVEAVAAATEQLSASIREIGTQVSLSSRIARQAAEDADRTDRIMEGLSQTANRVGQVVQMIDGIATQTNLLALNAGIEAARAGDAGRGFAVVAGEVKTLASQTGQATEEISSLITAMQAVAREAVDAIRTIGGTIREINQIGAGVAAAVEEQSAATGEIARNIGAAADSTQHVRQNIDSVARAASESGEAAERVLSASTDVAVEVRSLGTQVDRLVGQMRAG